jgi:asparagine synthase (glutamine-hydrolysing)
MEMYRRLISAWPSTESIIGIAEPGNLLTDEHAGEGVPDGVARMMYLDTLGYLPDDILTKVDRASMAVGLEARVPLLDHRLLALAWSLPLEWKVAGGTGKQILRDVLAKRVPAALTERPKMGFATPLGDWLRGPLQYWAEGLLDERRLERDGMFLSGAVRRMWRQHLSGRYNREHQLWPVLMFGQWLDHQRLDQQNAARRRPAVP